MPDIFKIAAGLTVGNARPLCAKHEPKASLQKMSGGHLVCIHCDECHFTAWVHPNTYYDMMVEDMLDEVDESIKSRG